jgi:hypothetical protein
MNKKLIIGILAFGGIGYAAYRYFNNTKKAYATIIVRGGASANFDKLLTFDKPYLKAWSMAVKSKQPSFTLNGLIFNTQGGSTKK